mmetsp:Transcript_11690/g.25629  ORF Transcript_11690/g.25629 Transcript_11690/m.25629 type:complete len:394 (+) Transcript_11690:189-1370(+)
MSGVRGITTTAAAAHPKTNTMQFLLVIAVTTLATMNCNAARTTRLATMLSRRATHNVSNDGSVVSSSLHGFPFVDENKNNGNQFLESCIFLHRGGSHSDIEDENNDGSDSLDSEAEDDIDQKVHTEDSSMQVEVTSSTTVSNNSQDEAAAAAATVETSTHNAPRSKKKSNAVGDPDGNSSDDESSDAENMDDDELQELNDLEKELIMLELLESRKRQGQQAEAAATVDEIETLVELARRREGMKRRIVEMERELGRRRGNGDRDEDEDDGETDLDDERTMAEEGDDGLEDEEETEDDESSSSATSYHLAGTNVTKEDHVLKRQRKYKRGSIFKDTGSTRKNKSTAVNNNSSNGATKNSSPSPAVPTTISSTALDNMLINAFSFMIFSREWGRE